MKTLRFLGMVLFAVLMCVDFASCSNEEIESSSEEKVTVQFNCIGDIINVESSPLGRATSRDLYGVQVYTSTGSQLIPYAYGIFTSLENVTLELLKSQKYTIQAMVVIDGFENYRFGGLNIGGLDYDNDAGKFYKSTTDYLSVDRTNNYTGGPITHYYPYEAYYGCVNDYSPSNEDVINIETKRASFGIKFCADNLNNGTISVDFGYVSEFELTKDDPDYEQIYIYPTDFDKLFYPNYNEYSNIECSITWNGDDESSIFLGSYSIKIKPNVKTIINIDVEGGLTTSKGLNLTIDDSSMNEEKFTIDDTGINPA